MKKHNFIFSCVRRFVAVVAVMSMLFTLTSLSSTWSWYTGTITVRGAEIQLAKLKAATMVNSARRTYTQPVSFADDEPEAEPTVEPQESVGDAVESQSPTDTLTEAELVVEPQELVGDAVESQEQPVAEASYSSVQSDEAPDDTAPVENTEQSEPSAEPTEQPTESETPAEQQSESVAEPENEPTAEPEAEASAESEPEAEPTVEPVDEQETETAAEPEAEPEGEPDGEPTPEVETVTEIYTQVCIVVSGTAARGYLIVTIDDMEYLVSETVPGDVIYFTVFGDVAVDAQAYPGEYELPEPEAIDPEEELLHNIDEEYDLEAGGVFAPPELSECFSDYSVEHVEPETLETPEDIASFEPDYPALPELPVEELPVLPEQPAEDEQPAEESPETPDLPGDAALPDGAEGEQPEADGGEAPPPENTAGDETERSDDVSGPFAD